MERLQPRAEEKSCAELTDRKIEKALSDRRSKIGIRKRPGTFQKEKKVSLSEL